MGFQTDFIIYYTYAMATEKINEINVFGHHEL